MSSVVFETDDVKLLPLVELGSGDEAGFLLKVKVAFETTFTSLAMIYEKLFPWEV